MLTDDLHLSDQLAKNILLRMRKLMYLYNFLVKLRLTTLHNLKIRLLLLPLNTRRLCPTIDRSLVRLQIILRTRCFFHYDFFFFYY